MRISLKRLTAVAGMVIPGTAIADIGADHAQLSIYLIQQQIASRVIIGELGDGPYARACQAIRASGLGDRIELRQGSGLQVLECGEVDTVVLAGMGGDTIVDILADDWEKAASFKRFVFQPMSKAEVLRRRLASQGWTINEEHLVSEKRRLFLALSSRPGHSPYQLTEMEFEFGPTLLEGDNEIKRRYLTACVHQCRRIGQQLLQSTQPSQQLEAERYRVKIERLEEILSASQS